MTSGDIVDGSMWVSGEWIGSHFWRPGEIIKTLSMRPTGCWHPMAQFYRFRDVAKAVRLSRRKLRCCWCRRQTRTNSIDFCEPTGSEGLSLIRLPHGASAFELMLKRLRRLVFCRHRTCQRKFIRRWIRGFKHEMAIRGLEMEATKQCRKQLKALTIS